MNQIQLSIQQSEETIATNKKLTEEAVASNKDATEQRTKEKKEYMEAKALNEAAVGLIDKATNILRKYYNKAAFKPAAVPVSDEEHIFTNEKEGLVSLAQTGQKQPKDIKDAPETWAGHRKNKGRKNNSVMALMAMLKSDIE